MLTADGRYMKIQLDWEVRSSDCVAAGDPAFVARIDGNTALFTPFRHLVVPPPLSAFNISVPTHIRQVATAYL